jgi:hypothetical protein
MNSAKQVKILQSKQAKKTLNQLNADFFSSQPYRKSTYLTNDDADIAFLKEGEEGENS